MSPALVEETEIDVTAEDFGPKNRKLPKSLQNAICEVIKECQEADRWLRLQEVLQDALLRYYDIDIQHLWNSNNIWMMAVPGNTYPTGDGGYEAFPDYMNTYPIFNGFAQIRQAKLSEPDIGIDFQPINPKKTSDREAARAAEAIRLMSDLDQDPHETVARKVYFTDMGGRCVTYKELCDDDSIFGTGPNGQPRRKIVWHIGGVLEWQMPIFANNRSECMFAFFYRDPDIKWAKARYPWIASKLSSGQMCLQEGAYQRIARLGIVRASQTRTYDWNIGNSLTHLITTGDCWLRTEAFVDCKEAYETDDGVREPNEDGSTKTVYDKIREL
ncbi:MAG TPA: hypothetical protein VFO86_06060, partial [Terriglobia bacterium]|nr:hypothetical protein [Terriglobia bacterium]